MWWTMIWSFTSNTSSVLVWFSTIIQSTSIIIIYNKLEISTSNAWNAMLRWTTYRLGARCEMVIICTLVSCGQLNWEYKLVLYCKLGKWWKFWLDCKLKAISKLCLKDWEDTYELDASYKLGYHIHLFNFDILPRIYEKSLPMSSIWVSMRPTASTSFQVCTKRYFHS